MTAEKRELNDQELSRSVGAIGFGDPNKRKYFDKKLRQIGHKDGKNEPILYVPCDKCGQPMHAGFIGWYCGPCKRHLYFVHPYVWHGTGEELIAAANKNL